MGIDLGLAHFAVLSDGRKVDNPRLARKAARKLRRAQQELARRQKGSANRRKAVRKGREVSCPGRGHSAGLAAQAVDHVDPREPSGVREDLAVSGLARTRLARSVADAGWSTFVQMLAYKAARHGRTLGEGGPVVALHPGLLACGAIGEAKPLHVREWTCACGAVHDRDVNAARNILAAGRADSPTLVELVSAGTPVPHSAVKREPAGSTA